jgi:hypothetical protein
MYAILENIWNEETVSYSRYCLGIWLKELRKPMKNASHDNKCPTEIGTQHLLKVNPDQPVRCHDEDDNNNSPCAESPLH